MTRADAERPFVAALGAELERAAPGVRLHLELKEGRSAYRGLMRRRWARGLAGWIVARLLSLGGGLKPGCEERFDLRNELVDEGGRCVGMLWHRTHYSREGPMCGLGVLRWEPSRSVLIDSIGRGGWLEVELVPAVEERAVVLRSGRQWLRKGRWRWPLARALVGTAETREWEEPDGRLGLSLSLHHPLFGAYAGYEAVLAPGEPP